MEIDDWRTTEAPLNQIDRAATRARYRLRSTKIVGAFGTLLVHVLVFQSVVLGARSHKLRPPDEQGVGATLIKSQSPPAQTLILMELPQASMSDQPLDGELASMGPVVQGKIVTVLSDDPLPHVEISKEILSDDKDAAAAVDSGDPSTQAALFGRYIAQIDARIERAWRRPRSPVNPMSDRGVNTDYQESANDDFKCQVRILQDLHGMVQEVQLVDCNGSVAWQHSLISAILASSPLAAPPTPAVFTRSLMLTFRAAPYSPTSSADDYEPRAAPTADRP